MSSTIDIDDYDRKILRALQQNADYSMAELGEKVGLSHTPCWRRIKRLEADGIIRGRVTLLDQQKLQLGVSVHAYVKVKNRDKESLRRFERAIADVVEVVECYSSAGAHDYLLRAVVDSVGHYDDLLVTTLQQLPNVAEIESVFALRQIKYTTELPL